MDDNDIIEALEEMLKNSKSEILLGKSFSMFKIGKENRISRTIIILLSLLLAYIISSGDTIPFMLEISNMLLDTLLALFGTIFTGYAFFQALLHGRLIAALIKDIKENSESQKKDNTLHITNRNFVHLMMQFIVAILVTLMMRGILVCLPDDFILFSSKHLNVLLSTALMSFYFYEVMVCLWRMVSFLFNIYQLFNSYAVTKYLAYIEKDDE